MSESSPEKQLVILITGSRDWNDQELIDKTLDDILVKYKDYSSIILIHGDCKGADRMAENSALRFPSWTISSSPADWKRYGRAAGPIRNSEMVKQAVELKNAGAECIVLAFHDCLEQSRGTGDCVKKAIKAGLEVKYIAHKD